MNIIYTKEQIASIANELGISKSDVNNILGCYSGYLQTKILEGKTVKILNICYLKNNNENLDISNAYRETLAYIATELSEIIGIGSVTIQRVLSTLEDFIVADIKNGKGYSLRGLVRIRCNDNGKVRIKKSTKWNGEPINVVTLHSFKRRIENAG